MEGYQFGKDIQSILNRLERLETLVLSKGKSPCHGGAKNRRSRLTARDGKKAKGDDSSTEMRSKTGHIGRTDDAECECQEQSITIWEDGRYEYTSSHYNHSRYPDDGDDHIMTIIIYAGDEIVHTFTCRRFVPNYETRILGDSGQSDRLRDRFDELDSWKGSIDCD